MTEPTTESHSFSEQAAANSSLQAVLEQRGDLLNSIPGIPAVLHQLMEELAQPPEDVTLIRVAELLGRDESLAAQCLRIANSPLFGLRKPVDSLRGAVRTLGIAHIREVVLSCSIAQLGSAQKVMDPMVFWEHSLACAIVSRKLARSVSFDDPEKAYLAGLLHDLGYVVTMILLPHEAAKTMEKATRDGIFIGEVELADLGFSHCQSGEVLASKWHFSSDIVEVIRCHHDPSEALVNPALVAIVSLADRLCRSSGLGIGYAESPDPATQWQADWKLLAEKCPLARQMSWTDFVEDSNNYVGEVREMVKAMYQATH
jgi:putative nucleotidyltransferase with HDIG domain